MEPLFSIEVIQDSNRWEIIAQYISSFSIIVASVVAAWLAGRKDRLVDKKKTVYFESLINILETKINISLDGMLELMPEAVPNPDDDPNYEDSFEMEPFYDLLKGCSNEIELLKSQIVEFSIYCPATATREIQFLFFYFETLIEVGLEYLEYADDKETVDKLLRSKKLVINSLEKISVSIKSKK